MKAIDYGSLCQTAILVVLYKVCIKSLHVDLASSHIGSA